MDFTLTDEQRMIRDTAREFTERELFPLERDFLLTGKLPLDKRKELELKGKELGFWALDVPAEYGGAGLDTLTNCLINEEIFRSPLIFYFGGRIEPALYACNDAQKERYFYPILRGEKKCCFAFTEPQSGSDFAGIRTRATKKGDRWSITGTKTFISNVDAADFIILYAVTDPGKGAKGISCFLVDKGTPGLTVSEPIRVMGDGWSTFSLFFDECLIPEENLVGELNKGFLLGDHMLTHGRLEIAAFNCGISRRCLEMATEYAKERRAFGKSISENQAIQWMLADSEVELMASRLLTHQAAWMNDNNVHIRNEAFVAKLHATETAQRVTDRALQIYGGMGYCLEVPIQSFYRQVRVWRIGHGTSEVHRMMIARNMLKN